MKSSIVHVISGLSIGGAEKSLYKLLLNLDRSRFDVAVISLTSLGPLANKITSIGIPVFACNMQNNFLGIFKLIRLLFKLKPDLTQTWMYHADVLGGVVAKLTGCKRVIWNIRNTHVFPGQGVSKSTYWIMRLNKFLSYLIPDRIICVANSARLSHLEVGYCKKKMLVIHNGVDVELFKSDSRQRKLTRESINIESDALLIGCVGRFNSYKNYKNFILTAKVLLLIKPNIFFALAGKDLDNHNGELCDWIDSNNMHSNFRLLGGNFDIPALMTSLDIFCLPSLSEGFPNVLAEAMSSSLPCVSTDVGDVKSLLTSDKHIVPVNDIQMLANSLLEKVGQSKAERRQLGFENRKKILDEFTIDFMVKRYENLYIEVLDEKK
jgi:glycosyltransferase involved in cell wall biosynthesis